MDKMRCESPDLTQANIDKLAELFPSVITEGWDKNGKAKKGVNFAALRQLLSSEILEGDEAYEFTWPGKKAAIVEAGRPIRKTLRPCPEESKNWDTTENLYIEGDNLDTLKLLQENYLGKVKMIYIDPPYNTGNDFIYRDNFAAYKRDYQARSGEIAENEAGERQRLFRNTDSNGRFHSDWCSMIYLRLMLARNLLSDDGVIFISCDDNEQENLKKICDEIFGNENKLGQITVVSNPRGRDYGGIARMHDYLFVYSKNSITLNLIPDENSQFKLFDENGGFELRELRNRNIKFNIKNRPNLYYPFYIDPTSCDENGLYEIFLEHKSNFIELYPLESQGIKTVWRWGKEKASQNLNINIKAKKMREGGFQIVEKYRESRMMARSVWWDKISNTERGTLLVKDIFDNEKIFDYPKPVEFIQRMLIMGTVNSESAIILDFFSGSATTAHAVMQLNAEDGGKRQFIMVQLPEECAPDTEAAKAGYKNICEIGKERIRRAGEKIKKENAGKPGIEKLDIGFRVLKCDSSNMKNVYYAPKDTDQASLDDLISNIKEDRSDLDLLFGCLVEWGLPLSLPYKTEQICGYSVHFYDYAKNPDDSAALAACFDANISEEAIKEIAKRKPLRAVFRDSSFATSEGRINAGELFKTLAPDTVVKVI